MLDTAGQEEYTALRDQWIRDGEGFILVYSITSRSSFSRIKNYYAQIQRVKEDDENYSLVLVGNKSDRSGERQISINEGQSLAKELGNIPFFESSAKLNINTENAFFSCARKCRLLRDPSAYQSSTNVPFHLQYQNQQYQSPSGQDPNNNNNQQQSQNLLANNPQSSNNDYRSNVNNNDSSNDNPKRKKKRSKCLIV